MKKIAYNGYNSIYILDSKDYVKIEEDDQHVDDKYVDYNGKKFNEYSNLHNGGLIMRELYHINLEWGESYSVMVKKFKNYELYYGSESSEINKVLNTKNSIFKNMKFDNVKRRIVSIFLTEIKIKII